MYYLLRYCEERGGRVNPYHDCYIRNVHLTFRGLLSKSPRTLCIKFKVQYKWGLALYLVTKYVSRWNFSKHHLFLRHVWTCGFKPLLNRNESIYYIIFLFEIMTGRPTTKLKTLSKWPLKAGLLLCFAYFLQQTWCPVMCILTLIGCQGDSTATLNKLMFLLSLSAKRNGTPGSKARC